ncbi:hypothetical protein [Thermus caliditerrae]|uniref:hypothetical protein n=1 Tax=Thermus caliditerrae TaxID=1330700 RepID=UPI001F37C5AE|nr:hypothetical protein [Thermus caliditerrae]
MNKGHARQTGQAEDSVGYIELEISFSELEDCFFKLRDFQIALQGFGVHTRPLNLPNFRHPLALEKLEREAKAFAASLTPERLSRLFDYDPKARTLSLMDGQLIVPLKDGHKLRSAFLLLFDFLLPFERKPACLSPTPSHGWPEFRYLQLVGEGILSALISYTILAHEPESAEDWYGYLFASEHAGTDWPLGVRSVLQKAFSTWSSSGGMDQIRRFLEAPFRRDGEEDFSPGSRAFLRVVRERFFPKNVAIPYLLWAEDEERWWRELEDNPFFLAFLAFAEGYGVQAWSEYERVGNILRKGLEALGFPRKRLKWFFRYPLLFHSLPSASLRLARQDAGQRALESPSKPKVRQARLAFMELFSPLPCAPLSQGRQDVEQHALESPSSPNVWTEALELLLSATPPILLDPDFETLLDRTYNFLVEALMCSARSASKISPKAKEVIRGVLRLWFQGPFREIVNNDLHHDILRWLVFAVLVGQEDKIAPHLKRATSLRKLAQDVWGKPLLPEPFAANGLVAVELTTPKDLDKEGRAMGHCMSERMYGDFLGGNRRFFSIRDLEGRRVATLVASLKHGSEEARWDVSELVGPRNTEVEPVVQEFVQELLARLPVGSEGGNGYGC